MAKWYSPGFVFGNIRSEVIKSWLCVRRSPERSGIALALCSEISAAKWLCPGFVFGDLRGEVVHPLLCVLSSSGPNG